MRRVPNTADPHGYYAEIGVRPDATRDEVRAAVRRLYFDLHPDTGDSPDGERMQRVAGIAEVLLDPDTRHTYDTTPPGTRMIDKVYAAELSGLLDGLSAEEVEVVLTPVQGPPAPHYDYLAMDRQDNDSDLAERWYHHLVAMAPLGGYRKAIKVMLHDGPQPDWNPAAGILMIPRFWEPSDATAFALFVVTVGCFGFIAGLSSVMV